MREDREDRERDVQEEVVKSIFCDELPLEHRPFVENLGNYVIVQVHGDGACMFNAVAAGIYGSDKQSWVLRSLFHYFIVEHWDFYKVPFKETVGVGGRQEVYVNFSSDF